MLRFVIGVGIGASLCLALGFASRHTHDAGQSQECQTSSGFMTGKKWACTPEEKARLAASASK